MLSQRNCKAKPQKGTGYFFASEKVACPLLGPGVAMHKNRGRAKNSKKYAPIQFPLRHVLILLSS